MFHRHQKLSLLVLFASMCIGAFYPLLRYPVIVLYALFASIMISLFVFALPLTFNIVKDRLRRELGQKMYEFFSRAGLTEKDMRTIIKYGKQGYQIGYELSNDAPHTRITLTTRKIDDGESPSEDDYLDWRKAIEIIEGTVECPMCGDRVPNACEKCGWSKE